MSATTFLLILAAVIIVFVAYVIKSWFELSSTVRTHHRRKRASRRPGERTGRDQPPED